MSIEHTAASNLALVVNCRGEAGRKCARDAAVWAEGLRKFPLLHPRPENHFLPMAPSALPPWVQGMCRGLGTLSEGTGSWAGGSKKLCCDRGDVGGKRDPSWLAGWN